MSWDLKQKWWKFHRANPHVYNLIVHYADEAKASGWETYSINGIFERIRWHHDVTLRQESDARFKLSNNHRAYYARLYNHITGSNFFVVRPLRHDEEEEHREVA